LTAFASVAAPQSPEQCRSNRLLFLPPRAQSRSANWQRGTACSDGIKPDFGEAYSQLGLAYLHLDKGKEAAESFKQALLFIPNDIVARYGLGLAYVQLGDKESAMQEYKALKELADGVEKQYREDDRGELAASLFKSIANELLKKIEKRFGTKSEI
jgi:tetratricopeptide (TPR) repeat protein